ncbi:hypothetical protein [Bradyrhizobium sp. USDA 3364]
MGRAQCQPPFGLSGGGRRGKSIPEVLLIARLRRRSRRMKFLNVGFSKMTFALLLIAAGGGFLLLAGFVAFALWRNALHSTARI